MGTSEFIARTLPAVIDTMTVPITFFTYRGLIGAQGAYFTAFLTSLLPLHIYYSQDIRPYTLGFLWVVLVTAALFRYGDTPDKKNRWLLAGACGLLVGTHYLGIFYVASAYLAASAISPWPEHFS